jgi:hypothetical protein
VKASAAAWTSFLGGKLQFFIKKIQFLFSCTFFPVFGHQNSGSGSAMTYNAGSASGNLIETNANPKYWLEQVERLADVIVSFSFLFRPNIFPTFDRS